MVEKSQLADAQGADIARARPIRIVKGLDIPIAGEPEQAITQAADVKTVALLGVDYPGLRPQMLVDIGDRVTLGQPLFGDRRHSGIVYTSPGSGIVTQINRGARRALLSVVVALSGDEEETFRSWPTDQLADLPRDRVTESLLASGLWTALRTRPFGRVPAPDSEPSSIFVTAMDSNPLAPDAETIINARSEDFAHGLTILSRLTGGSIFVCQTPMANVPMGNAANILVAKFSGPHPSGLVGAHIHHLDPVGAKKTVWHMGYQDVIAVGRLFTMGRLHTERVVALAGPVVTRPRLIRTRLGASIDEVTAGELRDVNCRIVSGSVLSSRHARNREAYLGRFHNQVSVIEEAPAPQRRGATTGFLPLGGFERVMPLDILPTQLLRALLVGDTDMAQALGCLELDEEDLALCSYVCPGKIDYGPLLRQCLDRIEKDG